MLNAYFMFYPYLTISQLPTLRMKRVGAVRIPPDQSSTTIKNIYPGLQYDAQVEACFGSDTLMSSSTSSDDMTSTTATTNEVVSEIALTNKVRVWSRAPPARPNLLLKSINQDEFEFSWDRPVLLDLGKVFVSSEIDSYHNLSSNTSICIMIYKFHEFEK